MPKIRAHPMIHSQHQQPVLPTAEQEEEVMESTSATIFHPSPTKIRPVKKNKDGSSLVFEISSTDGFKVQANSAEGKYF